MALSRDVKQQDGSKGHLHGKTAEQIYRAHHNLDDSGNLLPGFTQHQGKGCECDHCQEYLQRGNKPAAADTDVAT